MEFNWMLILIAALIAIILYLLKRTLSMKNTIDSLKSELLQLEGNNIQYIENKKTQPKVNNENKDQIVKAKQPTVPSKTNPIPLKNVVMPMPSYSNAVPRNQPDQSLPDQRAKNDSDSESEYESDSETDSFTDSAYEDSVSEDYVSNNKEIEKYGNDKKEMIIPININSLLQRAVEEHMNINIESNNNKITEIVPKDEDSPSKVSEMFEQTPESPKPIKQEEVTEMETLRQSLQEKNIIAIKAMAKELDIKITEGGKPKNKDTLISEIISKTNQNI